MSCRLWTEMQWSLCASVSRPRFANMYPASCLVGQSLPGVHFMNPHSAPDCLFWRFSAVVPCSPPLLDPVLAFSLHSFCPTVDEDTAVGCLSSLWRLFAPTDILWLEDTQMVDGSMLCILSLNGTWWSCFCCRLAIPSGNPPSPFLLESRSSWTTRHSESGGRADATVLAS